MSPYQFCSNNPISKIELDGLEGIWLQKKLENSTGWQQVQNVAFNTTSHGKFESLVKSQTKFDVYYYSFGKEALGTGYGPFIKRIQKMFPEGFRLAFIPIGSFEPMAFMHMAHMGPHDAIAMYSDLKVENAVPIHHYTFALGLDGQDEAKDKLLDLLSEEKNKNMKFKILLNGEVASF